MLTIEVIEIHPRGKKYRLIPTTVWGVTGLVHFIYAIWHRSFTYPNIQILTRLPEVLVIVIIAMFALLHGLVYIFTGGEGASEILSSVDLPQLGEDYTLAVFRLGTACLEAVRKVGLRNEVESVYVPRCTYFDLPSEPSAKSRILKLGFNNEIQDSIPIQSNRPNPVSIHSIYWGTLVKDFMTSLCQAAKVWARLEIRRLFRFARGIGIDWFFPDGSEEASGDILKSNNAWNMKHPTLASHQQLYTRFLRSVSPATDVTDFWDEEDDDDDDFTPAVDNEQALLDSEEEFGPDVFSTDTQNGHSSIAGRQCANEMSSEYVSSDEDLGDNNETLNLISEIMQDSESDSDTSVESTVTQTIAPSVASAPAISTLYAHMFHQGSPMTRRRYHTLNRHIQIASEMQLVESILTHRNRTRTTTQNSAVTCVVCMNHPRSVLLRPCRCLCLCDSCRIDLARRDIDRCPCCRRLVEGYSKVYLV
ncbi:hypothetical protein K493DRAFT_319251 [Basidiobolus meristosporus CBS 931.73]|uniref:RING-type domain-containing protein n=1 Tax=Basidiobolus meristosporus CBS 931.73 TaxID=1314790 RepID=A0A1Y1XSK7_9FUNG|nr:hypothetical protein K493DRAFT_319251 [Basidiobolus meristosporus CBS 931.73]|eukprot:ORX88742.1 hypothetical protein K493DRAFT_319251 [Basidiobolus meristosporus CBS 931.73]